MPKKLMVLPKLKFTKIFCVLIVSFLVFGCNEKRQDSAVIGCPNNTAGMLVNYAIKHYGSNQFDIQFADGFSSYLMMDCCSSKSTWSLTSGELDAAVLCPDAAAAFLEKTDDFLLAGPLTYNSEALVFKDPGKVPEHIGFMNGQERQKEILMASYYADAAYHPVLATSLPYALSVGQIDAAVLDIATAVTLDYQYLLIESKIPTSVLVVSKDFYNSQLYPALLLSIENAAAEIKEYRPFCEAMTFLFSQEMGRKEYTKWQSAEIKFPDLSAMAVPIPY